MAHGFLWLSATQISLGGECERKYGFRYILDIKQPTGPAQALGLACEQEEIVPYLEHERPFSDSEAGRIAAAAAPFLPAPRTPLVFQQKLEITNDRFGFLGYKDARAESSHILPGLDLAPGVPAVIDFKTTKWWRWRKTTETLKTDVQANLYAFDELITNPDLDHVDLYWVSMRTTPDKPLADAAHYRAHKDDVAAQFAAIETVGERLFQIRTNAPEADEAAKLAYVMSLTPNPDACGKFGGCPHVKTCNIGPKRQRAAAIVKLRTQKEHMSNVSTVSTLNALQRLKARKPAEATPKALGINPPEKDLPYPPPVITETEDKYGQYLTDEFLGSGADASVDVAPKQEATVETVPVVAAPKKRGRPPGSKNASKPQPEVTVKIEVQPETTTVADVVSAIETVTHSGPCHPAFAQKDAADRVQVRLQKAREIAASIFGACPDPTRIDHVYNLIASEERQAFYEASVVRS